MTAMKIKNLSKIFQLFGRGKPKLRSRPRKKAGFEPTPSTTLSWSQQDEEALKALRKAELATRILAGRKAMRQAEELRRAIQELEARKQAMLAIMLSQSGNVGAKLPADKLPSLNEGEVTVRRLPVTAQAEVTSELPPNKVTKAELPPQITDEQLLELVTKREKSIRQIARELGVSHVALLKRLKRLQSKPVG
jgi:hypothetical protein